MKSFEELCADISQELERTLKEEEIAFLSWIHQRHVEELEKENNPDQKRFI